jgi:hypothetical protein
MIIDPKKSIQKNIKFRLVTNKNLKKMKLKLN